MSKQQDLLEKVGELIEEVGTLQIPNQIRLDHMDLVQRLQKLVGTYRDYKAWWPKDVLLMLTTDISCEEIAKGTREMLRLLSTIDTACTRRNIPPLPRPGGLVEAVEEIIAALEKGESQ